MKAIYTGISHHKMVKGTVYDVTIHDLTVATSGDGYKYTFTYASLENLCKDWQTIDADN